MSLSATVSAQVFDADNAEQDPEREPIVRQNTRVENRERYNRNQRTTAQRLLERQPLLVGILLFLVLAFVLTGLVFWCAGWYIWVVYRSGPCDRPLAVWLIMSQCAPLAQMLVDCMIYMGCLDRSKRCTLHVLRVLLLVVGMIWFCYSKTCEKTSPELYTFVMYYLIYNCTAYACVLILPMLIIGLMIYGMGHGWFDELAGASPETIKGIKTVRYDASIFIGKEGDDGGDDMPPEECCCCCEPFGADKVIKRTPCKHYFHEECLGKWLRVSTTCPLCRNDLEEAVKYMDKV